MERERKIIYSGVHLEQLHYLLLRTQTRCLKPFSWSSNWSWGRPGNKARDGGTISSFIRDKRKSVCMTVWGYSPPQNRGWENLVRDYDWFHLQRHPRSQSASSKWDSSAQNITHLTFGSDTAPLTSVVRSDYTAKPLSEVNKLLRTPISIFMFVWLSNTLGPANQTCSVNLLVYDCIQG